MNTLVGSHQIVSETVFESIKTNETLVLGNGNRRIQKLKCPLLDNFVRHCCHSPPSASSLLRSEYISDSQSFLIVRWHWRIRRNEQLTSNASTTGNSLEHLYHRELSRLLLKVLIAMDVSGRTLPRKIPTCCCCLMPANLLDAPEKGKQYWRCRS